MSLYVVVVNVEQCSVLMMLKSFRTRFSLLRISDSMCWNADKICYSSNLGLSQLTWEFPSRVARCPVD